MTIVVRWWCGLLGVGVLVGSWAAGTNGGSAPTTWHRPELAYLKAVNRVGPPRDPQPLLWLMGQYAHAKLHRDGIEWCSTLVQELTPRLSDRLQAQSRGRHG